MKFFSRFFAVSMVIGVGMLYAVVNLGTYGKVYEIAEPDMYLEIKRKFEDLNETAIKKRFYEALDEYLQVHMDIPTCEKSDMKEMEPKVVVPVDVVGPNGEILAKAGTLINPLKNGVAIYKRVLFINANDPVQVALARYLGSSSTVLVTDGNVQVLFKNGVYAYKATAALVEAFGLECVPSVYTQKEDRFIVNRYDPEDVR